MQKNRYIEWDFNTITAADYTVEFRIFKETYDNWLSTYLDLSNPISEISQFRLFIKDEMEKRLSDMPCNKYHHVDLDTSCTHDHEEVKIAMITFAFDNAEIIKGLRKRGDAIKAEKWKKLDKANAQLTKMLKK